MNNLKELLKYKYDKYKSFQSSNATSYTVLVNDIDSVSCVISELTPYFKDKQIQYINMSVNNDLTYDIKFSVSFGYKDI